MRLTPLFVLLAVVSCKTPETQLDPPIGEFVTGHDEVASYVVQDAIGPAPATAIVRAVNDYGAAVPAEIASFTVGGNTQSVGFDGLGYGEIVKATPGAAEINGGEEKAWIYAMDSDWPGFGMLPASLAPVSGAVEAEPVTTGSVIAAGSEVWWVGPDHDGHRVLKADGKILGLQSGHIDVDGVLDAVAWSDSIVFLLRGRVGGGMAWAGALTSKQYTVGGAAIGELTGDNLPDVAIAWASIDGVSALDVWNGDGLFDFTPAEPRNLPQIPVSVSIGDQTGEGRNQITVLNEDATWIRFIGGTEFKYMPIGPNTPEQIGIVTNSTVEGRGDINNDGADELYFLGPLNPGSPRTVFIVDLLGPKIEFLPLNNPLAAYVTKDDANGNGITDMFMLYETQELHSLSFDETSTNVYDPRRLSDMPDHGPITLHDIVDANGVPDLFIAGDPVWWWYEGFNDPDDVDIFWRLSEPEFDDVTTSEGPMTTAELDRDPSTTELVVFQMENGDTFLKVFQYSQGAADAVEIGGVEVSDLGVAALDLAVCDDVAWVAMAGELVRVDLASPTAPVVSGTTATVGTRVDCGAAPSGAVAALLEDGTISLLDAGLGEVSSLNAAGAADLAIGDLGNGPEIRTCPDADCTITAWNIGPGVTAFAVGNPDDLSTIGTVGNSVLPGHGRVSTADVDGDGNDDLIAAGADGLIALYRSTGVEIGKGELFHTLRPLTWHVSISDADGDGYMDLWAVDDSKEVRHSKRPEVAGATTSTDTGDTAATDTAASP